METWEHMRATMRDTHSPVFRPGIGAGRRRDAGCTYTYDTWYIIRAHTRMRRREHYREVSVQTRRRSRQDR